jgi:hypothetical protein
MRAGHRNEGLMRLLRGVRDEVLSDQLSDYEVEDGYTTAHVHTRSSLAAGDIGWASGMLHTEGHRPQHRTSIPTLEGGRTA